MARIKHIAIATNEPDATAQFYIKGLGLSEVGRVDNDIAVGYYLSDGYINIAILKWRTEAASITEGSPRYTGIHHLGFEVDSLEVAQEQIESAGAVTSPNHDSSVPLTTNNKNVEMKFFGPDQVMVDLSETGWVLE